VVRADLRDEASVRAALANARPDAVCHLAGPGKVRESFEHPEEYHAVNAVYGVPERQPVTEDAPLLPTSPYGESKVAAEQAIKTAASVTEILTVAEEVTGRPIPVIRTRRGTNRETERLTSRATSR
jgi:UDP-glucose 4-epimerase